jgi:hypothetical protein
MRKDSRMTKFAVCVITIGDEYIKFYEKYFKKSHERYCKKYGYDLFIITEFLDSNPEHQKNEHITYQKFLIAGYQPIQDYDYVLILDADIYIMAHAGPLTEISDLCKENIAGVDEGADPSVEIREIINRIKEWPISVKDAYKSVLPSDISFLSNISINSGFLLFQPKLHKEFFLRAYEKWIEIKPCFAHREQFGISYELQIQDKLYVCDKRWNRLWYVLTHNPFQNVLDAKVFFTTFLPQTYCIHFVAKFMVEFVDFLERTNL